MIDDLSICITSFRRPRYLDRCLKSAFETGIQNVVVSSMEPDEETLSVLDKYPQARTSVMDYDNGCHENWIQAAYRSPTKRMILLHDDDVIKPELGRVYQDIIKPAMDAGDVQFCSWRAHLLFDNGDVRPTEWFNGETKQLSSGYLRNFLLKLGRLSLSPVVSILDRDVLIGALKEGHSALIKHEECLHNPGMLLGTELIAYLRHCASLPKWMFINQVLSMYGACESSGTVKAQKTGDLRQLTVGYDIARRYFMSGEYTNPVHKPRIIFVYDDFTPSSDDEQRRFNYAMETWKFHFNQCDVVGFPTHVGQWSRSSADLGDTRPVPYLRDLIDYGVKHAMPEDVVVYVNRDVFLTAHAPERIIESTKRNGISVAWRRNLKPVPGRMYKTVSNARKDGGVDLISVTPGWWLTHRETIPDMLIARECFDWVLRTMAEEMHGKEIYMDDVIGHEPHTGQFWKTNKKTNPGQQHNRALAKVFFARRRDRRALMSLQ